MIKKQSSFDEEFLHKIRRQLEEEREKLKKELEQFTKKNPHLSGEYDTTFPEYGDKEDENAQEIAEYATNKPLEETLERMLRDVNKALLRLDNDNYGVCKYCDKLIDEKRLLARPTSSACVSCKKALTDEV